MDDIVLRLRALAEPGASFGDVGGISVLTEAADEIERLRKPKDGLVHGLCFKCRCRAVSREEYDSLLASEILSPPEVK